MITKPTIIFTSLGRTGTLFFQSLYRDLYPKATSLHEPDYFNFGQYPGLATKLQKAVSQISTAGFSNLVIKKSLGKWSVVDLSHGRLRGIISKAQAADLLLSYRQEFISKQTGPIYIESSSAWFGLLDILDKVFENHRAVYLIRNGIDWVRSKLNFGNIYDKGSLRSLVSKNWPTALDIQNDPYQHQWAEMSRFERICWAWTTLNNFAIESVKKNPSAKIIKFEDIFHSDSRYQHLQDLIAFTSGVSTQSDRIDFDLLDKLDQKIHPSKGTFPQWENWTQEQQFHFTSICGDLMDQFGYPYNQPI